MGLNGRNSLHQVNDVSVKKFTNGASNEPYAAGRPYLRVSPARCEQRALPASEISPAPPVDDYTFSFCLYFSGCFLQSLARSTVQTTMAAVSIPTPTVTPIRAILQGDIS